MMEGLLAKFFIIPFLPFMCMVVFVVHECGHYLMARLYKVGLSSFSIGAGRILWQKNTGKKQAPFYIRLWPISGQVELNRDEMRSLSPVKRLSIIFAGPAANFILPFFLFFSFFVTIGQPFQPAMIAAIMTDAPAHQADLQLDDKIVAIDGQEIRRFQELADRSRVLPVKPMLLTIERNGETMSVRIVPEERSYIDRQGIKRSHGLLGIHPPHGAFKIEDIHAVDGADTEDGPDKARELLIASEGKAILISVLSADDKMHDYRVRFYSAANKEINNLRHEEHDYFYLSPLRNSHYLDLSVQESLGEALAASGKMLKDMARLPLQLFPIDKTIMNYGVLLNDDVSPVRNGLFLILYKTALLSVIIGLVNLLPLPRLDGSHILFEIWETATGRLPEPRQRAVILTMTFLVLYLSILAANMFKMPHYFEKKIARAQEWLDDRAKPD